MVANPQRAASPWMGMARRDMEAIAGWAAVTLGGALAVWMHNLGAFALAALLLTVFPAVQWRLRGSLAFTANTLLSACLVLALWAPFLPWLLVQSQRIEAHYWQQSFTFWVFTHGMKNLLFPLFPSDSFIAIIMAVCAVGVWAIYKARGYWAAHLVVGAFLFPVLFAALLSIALRPMFVPRTILWVTIPFYVLIAAGLAQAIRSAGLARIPLAILAAYPFIFSDWAYITRPPVKEPWREITAAISTNFSPKDTALVIPSSSSLPLIYYSRASGQGLNIVPLPAPYPAHGMDRKYPVGVADPAMKPGDEKRLLGYDCQSGAVWYVDCGATHFDPHGIIYSNLAGRCGLLWKWRWKNIVVFKFGKGAPEGRAGRDEALAGAAPENK